MPLRLKLLVAVIVLVFAGLAVSNIVTYTSLRSSLFKRADQQLVAAEGPVAWSFGERHMFPGPPGASQVPSGTYGEVRDSSGAVLMKRTFTFGGSTPPAPRLPSSLKARGSDAGPRIFTARAMAGSTRYRVLVDGVAIGEQRVPGNFVVAIPLSEVDNTLSRLRLTEGIVSGVVLLGLGFISYWLVRRGLRPLEEIGVTAGAIAAGDLTRRVEPTDDRTEIGRLGLALNEMLAQIEAAFDQRRASEARLRRFVADASHELRTPLTSIRGYAELFRRGADSRPEDLAKSMQRIEAEAARMGVLVDDLLLLARLDQGRPLEREEIDVARIVAEATESARAVDPDRPISLIGEGPAMVVGDQVRLRQVLDNLLDNTRVHTAKGTPVRVEVGQDNGEVILSVSDEGPGLPADVAPRVFERFYRGDPARSRGTGGAGLGLSIVSAIVQAHGGTVSAASPNGSGTTFEVRLPAALKEKPEVTGQVPAGEAVTPASGEAPS